MPALTTEAVTTLAETTLSGAITNVATSIPVTDRSKFPQTGQFRLLIQDSETDKTNREIFLVTGGQGAGAGSFTITSTAARGIEGTTAVAHASGSYAFLDVTAASLDNIIKDRITSRSPFVLASAEGIAPGNTAAANKTALDAVMTGALASGGTLLCDWDGTVLVDVSSTTVTIPDGVTIEGRGWKTIMKMTPDPVPGTMTSTSLKLLSTNGDIVIRNIMLQGAQVNAADAVSNVGTANSTVGVAINANGRARLFNCKFFQFSFQVWTTTTQASLEAYDCDFVGFAGAQKASGILDSAGGYMIVDGCHFWDLGLGSAAGGANSNQFHGIYTAESSNLQVRNCRFTSMYGTGYGVQIYGDVRGNRYSRIEGCYFERQPSPQLLVASPVAGGGTFAAGTYFWKVSAVVGGVETAGSIEASATVALNGHVDLTWQAVPGATAYKVYRATTTNGQSAASSLVATLGNVLAYTDTGTAVTAGSVAQGDNIRGIFTNQFTQTQIVDCTFDLRNLAIQVDGGRCKISRCRFGGDVTVASNNFQIYASAVPNTVEIEDCVFEGNNTFDIMIDQASGYWKIDRNIFRASPTAVEISAGANANPTVKITRNRFMAQTTRAIEMDGVASGTGASVTIESNVFNTQTGECIRTITNTLPMRALYILGNDFSQASGVSALISQRPTTIRVLDNYGTVGYPGETIYNQSTAAQSPAAATRTYITGSQIAVPPDGLRIGTVFRWKLNVTKTAAGIASSTFDVAIGTAGTVADTARLSFVKPAGTAVVDEGLIEIIAICRGPLSASGVFAGEFSLIHNLSATGLATTPCVVLNAISAAFDVTVANLFVGLAVTSGASELLTLQVVTAEAWNI